MWLMPFLVIYFHRISVIGIFLNLWVGLLIAIESFAAMLAVFAAQISTTLAAPLVYKLTEILNWIMIHAAIFRRKRLGYFQIAALFGRDESDLYFVFFAGRCFSLICCHKWKPFST